VTFWYDSKLGDEVRYCSLPTVTITRKRREKVLVQEEEEEEEATAAAAAAAGTLARLPWHSTTMVGNCRYH